MPVIAPEYIAARWRFSLITRWVSSLVYVIQQSICSLGSGGRKKENPQMDSSPGCLVMAS